MIFRNTVKGRHLASLAIVSLAFFVGATGGGRAAAAPPAGEDRAFFILAQVAHDVGGPIHAAPASVSARQQHVVPLNPGGAPAPQPSAASDGALQTSATTPLSTTDLLTFDGVGVGITPTYTDCCAPPDTNLAVGATQVVEWVNTDFAAFDKSTGALLSGPTAGNSVWAGFSGGHCATNNDGDPIVQYDKLAARWVMTQFSVTGGPPYFQCVAVSNTSNFVTTTWNRYAFSFGTQFPDYPKLGVWPDAYYMSFNLYLNGSTFSGAAACAFDRAAIQAGQPTNGHCFNMGAGVASLLPSDLDGATGATGSTQLPPAGSPDFFLNFGSNSLNVWKFHIDFANSAKTTMTGPTSLAVGSFADACGGGTCIPQLSAGQRLDSLGDRLMYRLAYRNFGDHESLVVTHSVQGSGTAAPRWYELRSNAATAPGVFSIYQQSSYAPDATYRWMGSAAMDKNGNLAIGYSASSKSIYPAIRYSGRAAADPLSTLRQEKTIIAGGGSQSGFGLSRWGDYSAMTLDPADDCTFWFATEYLKNAGAFNWSTRVASFSFPSCGNGPTVTSVSPTSGPVPGGTVVTVSGSGFTGASALQFGANAATNFKVNTDARITATSPAGSGTVDVRVSVGGQTSATSAADEFTYVAAPTPCSAVSFTADPASSATIGTTVALSASATCTGTPQYRFYIQVPGTSVYSVVQDWSTTNTYSWNTTGLSAGTAWIQVQVRTQGGSGTFEALSERTYTLN